MKFLLPSVTLLLAASAFAQAPPPKPYTSLGGWGSVAFPGMGHPPAGGYTGGHAAGGYHGGYGGTVRAPYAPSQRYYRRNAYAPYVYAYPVYVNGDNGYAEQEPPPPPQVTVVNNAPPAPTVIINQNFGPGAEPPGDAQAANDTVRIYNGTTNGTAARPAAVAPAATDAQYYLIALKDHSIYSALAYWVEDNTLHYVMSPNMHNQTSLSLVDTDLTTKLNDDRGVPVNLSPAR